MCSINRIGIRVSRVIISMLLVISFLDGCSTSKPIKKWQVEPVVFSAALAADDGKIIIPNDKGNVGIVDLKIEDNVNKIQLPHDFLITRVACSGDICWFANEMGNDKCRVLGMNIKSKKIHRMIAGLSCEDVGRILLINKEERLVIGGFDGKLTIIDTSEGRVFKTISNYITSSDDISSRAVYAFAYSHKGRVLYVGSGSGVVTAVDIVSGEKLNQVKLTQSPVGDIVYSIFQDRVYVAVENKLYFLDANLNIEGQKTLLKKDDAILMACTLNTTNNLIACSAGKGTLAVFNLKTNLISLKKINEKAIVFVSFIQDGKSLITVSEDGRVAEWAFDQLQN